MEDDGDKPKQELSDDEEEDINPLQHLANIFRQEDLIQERKNETLAKLSFYREFYGFKTPVSVLVDQSFLRLVLAKRSDDIDRAKCLIRRFLTVEFKLFATSCDVGRCSKALGDCALLVEVINCNHEKHTSSDDCLKEILENNAEGGKFILATCDMEVLENFEGTRALPIVFANQRNWSLRGAPKEEKEEKYLLRSIYGKDASYQSYARKKQRKEPMEEH